MGVLLRAVSGPRLTGRVIYDWLEVAVQLGRHIDAAVERRAVKVEKTDLDGSRSLHAIPSRRLQSWFSSRSFGRLQGVLLAYPELIISCSEPNWTI